MTDTDTGTPVPNTGPASTETDGTAEGGTSIPPESENGSQPREMRYRLERNSAQAERDALAQRVEQLQTREVERIASKALSAPADLLTLGGVTLKDLLDDDGNVDPEKVNAVAADVLGSRPGLRPNAPAHDPSQGQGSSTPRSNPSWGDLLR